MKTLAIAAAIAGSLLCTEARAQERVGTTVAGVVAGALILGPLGAVAGGLVGYTAGPEMSRGLTAEPPRARSKIRRTARSADSPKRAAANVAPTSLAAPRPQVAQSPAPAPAAAKPPSSIRATQPLPAVQAFD